ncbi:hypothetical protein NE865_07391 [Phthorimaea operculella]|nr:hypothetical protein NE865_07391 [Phthorimaea operculella]
MGEDEIKNDEEAGPSSGKKEKNGRLIDDEDNTEGKSNHDQRDNEHDAEDARSYTDSSVSYRSRASGRSIRNNKSRKQTELRISERRSEKGDGPERKRRVRRGRVRKPRRSVARKRYHPVRRGDLKRRPREDSLSSFGARSSRSIVGVASRICAYCGHRCCSRRCKGNIGTYSCRRSPDPKTISRQLKKNRELKSKKNKRNIKLNAKDRKKTSAKERNKAKRKEKVVISDGVQKGSRSKMLSPLFVSTNERLGDDGSRDDSYYLEITPEMICDTVEKLTKWRQSIPIEPIANHILQRHPVNPDKEMLIEELSSKLAVATITGLLDEEIKRNVRQWRLSCEILRRGLTVNQVTLFWKIYCDTMQPIRRRILGEIRLVKKGYQPVGQFLENDEGNLVSDPEKLKTERYKYFKALLNCSLIVFSLN